MDPTKTPRRLLVVGSPDFPYSGVIGEALLHWWLSNDRPHTELVVDNTPVGLEAGRVWNVNLFPIHQHPAPLDDMLNEAYRREVMLDGVHEALIFETAESISDWLTDLHVENVPYTRVLVQHG
jgi:hypothetical protein